MSSIGVRLPLVYDQGDGFVMNKTLKRSINQNLKMLILTNPGEKVMDPNFGVGMRKFLFEQNNPATHSTIRAKIIRQVLEYLPFIDIQDIEFSSENNDASIKSNALMVTIKFIIAPLGIVSTAQITV